MAIMINDSSRYAAAAASRALSFAIRAEALADEIDALHATFALPVTSRCVGHASAAIPPVAG
jgi:hypothetical protein